MFNLWRDYKHDKWIVEENGSRAVVLVTHSAERARNFIKMRVKIIKLQRGIANEQMDSTG